MRPELCNRNARRYDEPTQRAETQHEAYQSCRNADQKPMLEPEHGQRCRVEYREDQAQRALTDHKAADRVVDLASKNPDGIALCRRYPGPAAIRTSAGETGSRTSAPWARCRFPTGKLTLIMAGVWTSVCVMIQALDAKAAGFKVYAVPDASGNPSEMASRNNSRPFHSGRCDPNFNKCGAI
jgi:hypothetical protein